MDKNCFTKFWISNKIIFYRRIFNRRIVYRTLLKIFVPTIYNVPILKNAAYKFILEIM